VKNHGKLHNFEIDLLKLTQSNNYLLTYSFKEFQLKKWSTSPNNDLIKIYPYS
jgi:hypothetical protein